MNTMNRALSIGLVAMATYNCLFLSVNGIFMLLAPQEWYFLIPGVTSTGLYNQHFIRDIGLIQMYLGIAFGLGLAWPADRFKLWAAATVWLVAHALFHVWEVAAGICGSYALARDFPAVSLPALMGIALSIDRKSTRLNSSHG